MNDFQKMLYVLIRAGAPIDKTTVIDGKVELKLPDYIIFENGSAIDYGYDW